MKLILQIILMLVISSLIIGCVDAPKSIASNNILSTEEQKLIGTWKIDTNMMKGSFTFNSDKTGTFSTQIRGNIIFNWKVSDGRLHTDIDIYRSLEPGGIQYKIVNNDKTLDFGGMYFDKSLW